MLRTSVLVLVGFLCGPVHAQPANDPLAPSVLDLGSAVVDVYAFTLPAPDGTAPDHRIGVLVPRTSAPPGGRPAVFLLDGQAVLEHLTDAVLASQPLDALPVIVTIGYATDRRFPTEARTRDLTPPTAEGGPLLDPMGRPGGGAPAFLALVRDAVVPLVAAITPIDPARRTLWGHSYGGVFVLFAAQQDDTPFSAFVAASPALWWEGAEFLRRLEAHLATGRWPVRPLTFHVGGRELGAPTSRDPTHPMVTARAALPDGALQTLDATARRAGIPGGLTVLPGQSHGATFVASALATALGRPVVPAP